MLELSYPRARGGFSCAGASAPSHPGVLCLGGEGEHLGRGLAEGFGGRLHADQVGECGDGRGAGLGVFEAAAGFADAFDGLDDGLGFGGVDQGRDLGDGQVELVGDVVDGEGWVLECGEEGVEGGRIRHPALGIRGKRRRGRDGALTPALSRGAREREHDVVWCWFVHPEVSGGGRRLGMGIVGRGTGGYKGDAGMTGKCGMLSGVSNQVQPDVSIAGKCISS